MVDILQTVVIIIHPLLAIAIIFWMYKQYQYRSKKLELPGEVADDFRVKHEQSGRLLYRSALIVTAFGIISNFIMGFVVGDGYVSLLPSSLHGWFGIIGIILLTFIVNTGKMVRDNRESGKSFAFDLQRHSRASDLAMGLITLHAFLGFIYLFQLLAF